jgi:cytochrome c
MLQRLPSSSRLLPALVALGLLTAGCRSNPGPPPPLSSPAFYTSQVQPILRDNCFRCHASLNHKGGLRLDSRAAILLGGKNGPILIPGHPERSLLVTLIRHEGPASHPTPMPPKGKLSDADIATIERWIQAGALMPADQ